MAHPHNEHRAHLVEHRRVAHIAKGHAHGGAVKHHEDEKEDRAMVKHMVKKTALKASGGAVKARMDRAPRRAAGGKVKHKGKTTVNVMVGHPGAGVAPPMPMAPPVAAMPPRPPMAPPMPPPGVGAGPPGMPPGMPPPGMMPPGAAPPGLPMGPHHRGGRIYAKGGRIKGPWDEVGNPKLRARGGAVKDGPAWMEGKRAGTQVQHSDGKKDGKDIGRGKAITYKTGGAVEHPVHGGMGPKLPGGGAGGEARLAKQKLARREYATPKGAHG